MINSKSSESFFLNSGETLMFSIWVFVSRCNGYYSVGNDKPSNGGLPFAAHVNPISNEMPLEKMYIWMKGRTVKKRIDYKDMAV